MTTVEKLELIAVAEAQLAAAEAALVAAQARMKTHTTVDGTWSNARSRLVPNGNPAWPFKDPAPGAALDRNWVAHLALESTLLQDYDRATLVIADEIAAATAAIAEAMSTIAQWSRP